MCGPCRDMHLLYKKTNLSEKKMKNADMKDKAVYKDRREHVGTPINVIIKCLQLLRLNYK